MASPSFDDFFSLEKFAHRDLWEENGPVWSALIHLDRYLREKKGRIEIEVPPHVYLDFPELISIGKGTVIDPGVYIQGPCIIGKNCILKHGAFLRGGSVLGDHVVVGHAAEIKHSILFDYAAATHFSYVGDSIVGSFANLGAGVKCANLRFDRKNVKPGLSKFGACIGERVQVGCNAVLNPGTLVGRETIIFPLMNVGGIIAPKSTISRKTYVS
jgi:NDP-sugar pyrophosphorylase family protein